MTMIKRMMSMTTAFLVMTLFSLAVFVSGCHDLTKPDPNTGRTPSDQITDGLALGQPIAVAADPLTNGLASTVYGGVSTIINALLGINSVLLKRRNTELGNALKAVEDHPDSPPVLSQIKSPKLQATVKKVLADA